MDVIPNAMDALQLAAAFAVTAAQMAAWDNALDVERLALLNAVVVQERVPQHVLVIAVKVVIMIAWIRVETHVCLNVQIPALIPA